MRTLIKRAMLALGLLLILGVNGGAQVNNLPDGLYAEMETSKGTIILSLEFEKVPLTVANFVGLAEGSIDSVPDRGHFYDGIVFHRVIDNFMIQTGDPKGTGTGGPGYSFPDEFHPELRHSEPGILSMANSGPDSNGSQFFITHVATPWLDDKHSVFGHVVEGIDVVNAIGQGDKMIKVSIIRKGSAADAFKVTQSIFDNLIKGNDDRDEELAKAKLNADLKTISTKWPEHEKTSSGIRYIVINEGSGRKSPEAGTRVTVHYTGSLLNGTVFDGSKDRGPLEVEVGRVIEGWNQMLKEMKKGEKRLVIVPPELGYGSRGYPGVIPPDSFLVFEIEIIDFD
jgi:cyclophilin family peptidyl-prolyl cis-trans isomerase